MDTKVKSNIGLGIRFLITIGSVIIIILTVLFYWVAKRQEAQIINQVDLQARTLFQQIILTRAWVSARSDIYSDIAGAVELIPAVVTRELSELAEEENNYSFKITSLDLINPNNAPTDWEKETLESFELGESEENALVEMAENGEVYRYMAPLYVKEDCLRCHEGYQIGDVRGGISVTVSMAEARAAIQSNNQQLFLIAFGIIAITLTTIGVLINYQISRPLGELQRAAITFSHGDLTAKVPVRSQDEIGTLATVFNTMSAQLHALVDSQERTIVDRTRALETSINVSQQLSTILDSSQLIAAVVEEIQTAFNYYHVHIYLFDEDRQALHMVGGTGKAGQIMLSRGHKIASGEGLVGSAAASNQTVIVSDVSEDPTWLPNPLLPDTKSEVAIPIITSGRALGVLDVQQNIVGGLTEEDTYLLQSVTSQVAIALRNARLFEQAQKQADREVVINRIGQNIQAATDIESVLRIAAKELGRAMDARRANAQLHNPGSRISARQSNNAGDPLSEKLT
ncbi:MAG: DUF3365 domain-containing protein [Chloroflexi bacterium]|nr:DUF3365 domain-containing protein [Chloroflexota bacterium]